MDLRPRRGHHITVQLGRAPGVVDVHTTDEHTDARERLWAASRAQLRQWLEHISLQDPQIGPLLRHFRTVDVEWLKEKGASLIACDGMMDQIIQRFDTIADEDELVESVCSLLKLSKVGEVEMDLRRRVDARYLVCLGTADSQRVHGLLFQAATETGPCLVYLDLVEFTEAFWQSWSDLKRRLMEFFTPSVQDELDQFLRRRTSA